MEMVDSVDDLKSSCSIKGIRTPDISCTRCEDCFSTEPNLSASKSKVSLEELKSQKEDRFLRGRHIAHLIYEYFRVIGANDSVENYSDLFTVVLRNDDIQEFDSKWDGILLSMTKIPSEDILEGLYKLRIRESEKLKTVLELYNMEIHQMKAGPHYHRLKTMVKRSIEQNLRIKNFGARSGNFEKNALVKNQGTKQRERRTPGECWQWKANRQCSKGDNGSFRHDISERANKTQPNLSPSSCTRKNERNVSRTRGPRDQSHSGRMFRLPCKDYLKGTCTNSSCEKWHPPECLFYKTENGCRFGEKCSYAHRQVEERPSKRLKKNGDKSAVAMLKSTRQLGCVFHHMEPPKSSSILRKSADIRKPIRCVKFTKTVARHTNIRDQNPSLGMICPGDPHQRNPNAPNFEDRSPEETEWQERCVREAAWRLAKSVQKLKEKTKKHSSHLRKIGACLHPMLNLRNENLLSTPERRCT